MNSHYRHVGFFAVLGVVSILAGWVDVANSSPADTLENRRAAAKLYLTDVPIRDLMEDYVEKFAVQVPLNDRETVKTVMREALKIEHLEKIIFNALVKVFTPSEIESMRIFNRSPDGKSIQKKAGDYMLLIQPAIMDEVSRALTVAREKHPAAFR